jgi:LIVCS family branched-chain amino acid:cation transporter
VTLGAFIPAVFDFCKTLPEGVQTALHIPAMTELGRSIFPFFDLGLGWVVPALIGLVIGVVLTLVNRGKAGKAAA